jgi:hypothetical protein
LIEVYCAFTAELTLDAALLEASLTEVLSKCNYSLKHRVTANSEIRNFCFLPAIKTQHAHERN